MGQRLQTDYVYERIKIFVKEESKGKSSFSSADPLLQKMYFLYNTWYGTNENNLTCSLCAGRIYKRLKNLVELHGEQYDSKRTRRTVKGS